MAHAQGSQSEGGINNRDLILKGLSKDGAPIPEAMPRGYALVIGIAKYQKLDPSEYLAFPESDAEAMYRVLISQEGGAFPAENVHVLKGSQATLAAIRRELEVWLPSVAQPQDRVVVYFAGHGFVKGGRGYLAAWDIDPRQPEISGYPMDTLGDVLARRVKAHWKVLLTDACHSGKISAETNNETVDAQFSKLPRDFLTFTATTAREQSFEDPKLSTGFGLFTYFLVQGWKGNADNDPCDGVITASELVAYTRTNVERYARERNVYQTPRESGDYEPTMPLGMHRGCVGASSAAPSMQGAAVIETNMDNVQIYVDGNLVGTAFAGKPLSIPGLASGPHTVEGVRPGYEPDHKEVVIAPGQQAPVSIRIRYVKQVKKAAQDLNSKGEKLLETHRSSLNLIHIETAQHQSTSDLRQAQQFFAQSLSNDSGYSTAAFNLGQVDQLLSDEKGSLEAYKRAIGIDPSYTDARLQYSAVLIENGDADEAIRQLTEAIRLEPSNDQAYSMMSRAYWDKGVWAKCIELADKAISLKPSNDQAHLWRADAVRQLGAQEKPGPARIGYYTQARQDYKTFLTLTNFTTPIYDWFAFHFIGFGLGSRKHADRKSAYDSQRSSGFLGLCLCDQRLDNPLQARDDCQRAQKYDSTDPIVYFELGNVYRDLYNVALDKGQNRCDYLVSARDNYAQTIKLNRDLEESRHAAAYLDAIDSKLPAVKRRGCS
jgi:tetratricopeptide (TPR) repeat protein